MIGRVALFLHETDEGRVTSAADSGSRVRPMRNIRRARRAASSQDWVVYRTAPASPHPFSPELFVPAKVRQPFERGPGHVEEQLGQRYVLTFQPDDRKPLLEPCGFEAEDFQYPPPPRTFARRGLRALAPRDALRVREARMAPALPNGRCSRRAIDCATARKPG